MLWSIETDDFNGNCGEKYPLLKTLNAELRGGVPSEPTKPTVTPNPSRPTEQPTTQPPATPPPNGICKKAGFVRDEKDCNVFYQCVNHNGVYQVVRFTCPSELVFDTNTNSCNYKNAVPECN